MLHRQEGSEPGYIVVFTVSVPNPLRVSTDSILIVPSHAIPDGTHLGIRKKSLLDQKFRFSLLKLRKVDGNKAIHFQSPIIEKAVQ